MFVKLHLLSEPWLIRMGKVKVKSRLDDAYDFLTNDPVCSLFMGLERARCIILITWFLYDSDSENSGLNLTEFESWPWEDRIYSTRKFLGCYKKSENWRTEIVDNEWMVLVRVAWDRIEAEREVGRGQKTAPVEKLKTNKRLPSGLTPRQREIYEAYIRNENNQAKAAEFLKISQPRVSQVLAKIKKENPELLI